MDIGDTRKPQNGRSQHSESNSLYSLRFSTLPVRHTESLAIRILPQESQISLQELFLFPNQTLTLKKWLSIKSGIILFTGPTGSGKTTALYSLLEQGLKDQSYQTITLEDPIEKNLEDILQVQVNEKAGITYQTGLKAALRHDPDIIMIGEIRDSYTAKFAFKAALTGHLVLSTLHAKNAIGTIYRLEEMGISKTDIYQSLIAIAAIELLPIQMSDNIINRRAAILEILDGDVLEKVLNGGNIDQHNDFITFEKLKRKAYAYGYLSKEIYLNT